MTKQAIIHYRIPNKVKAQLLEEVYSSSNHQNLSGLMNNLLESYIKKEGVSQGVTLETSKKDITNKDLQVQLDNLMEKFNLSQINHHHTQRSSFGQSDC